MTEDTDSVLEKREAERDRVLDCILPHVMFDGWSRKTLRHGAEDAGISITELDRLFPAGVTDCIGHFLDRADRDMVALAPAVFTRRWMRSGKRRAIPRLTIISTQSAACSRRSTARRSCSG